MSQHREKLQLILNSIIKDNFSGVSDVKIKPATGNGASASTLFEATVTTSDKTIEIFAKITSLGAALDSLSNQMFVTEEFVYKILSNTYEEIQNKHGITDQRFIFPKCFATNATSGIRTIVLENLVTTGYKNYDRLKCIDWKYASKCVETLATFHALSLALSKEYPDVFKIAGERMQMTHLTGPEWDGLADGALAAVDEADREKLSQLLEGSEGWSKFKELTDARKTPVVLHGDFRAGNLMHKEVDGDLHVIPVDYKTCRLGCPVGDLIYFIMMGTDQQFRRQHYHQLVEHYYQQLALVMTRLGLVPEEVYGREEFESDMKAKLPLGLCVAGLALPFVTVDPSEAPNYERGEFVPRANELFVERFRALVEDFKEWGFI